MRIKIRINTNKAQAVIEYAIILSIVALALGMMTTYLRRSIQAGIKIAADEIGLQKDSEELDPTKGATVDFKVRASTEASNRLEHLGQGAIRKTVKQTNKLVEPSQAKRLLTWEEE